VVSPGSGDRAGCRERRACGGSRRSVGHSPMPGPASPELGGRRNPLSPKTTSAADIAVSDEPAGGCSIAGMDWSRCPDAERTPCKVWGGWCVKGTRLPVQAIIDIADAGCTAEKICTEIYEGVPVEVVKRILQFAYVALLRAMFAEWRDWPVSRRRQRRLDRLERQLAGIDAALLGTRRP
jgi:uncharacterized protein (DUF433 family)